MSHGDIRNIHRDRSGNSNSLSFSHRILSPIIWVPGILVPGTWSLESWVTGSRNSGSWDPVLSELCKTFKIPNIMVPKIRSPMLLGWDSEVDSNNDNVIGDAMVASSATLLPSTSLPTSLMTSSATLSSTWIQGPSWYRRGYEHVM